MTRFSRAHPVAEIRKTMRAIHRTQTDAAEKLSILNVNNRKAILLSLFPAGTAFQNKSLRILHRIMRMRPNHPGRKLRHGFADGIEKGGDIVQRELSQANVPVGKKNLVSARHDSQCRCRQCHWIRGDNSLSGWYVAVHLHLLSK